MIFHYFCSNGSIIQNMELLFASASVPSNTLIGKVLINAASNITAFNIDVNSVSVDGIRKLYYKFNVQIVKIWTITIQFAIVMSGFSLLHIYRSVKWRIPQDESHHCIFHGVVFMVTVKPSITPLLTFVENNIESVNAYWLEVKSSSFL